MKTLRCKRCKMIYGWSGMNLTPTAKARIQLRHKENRDGVIYGSGIVTASLTSNKTKLCKKCEEDILKQNGI